MEIRRFGVGNRRPDGPPGTKGIAGQVIHADGRGVVSELAFARRAAIEPHSNPNTTWFVVIEGGGWVVGGGERALVAAGEAVLWPADVPHAAWTELSEMRVIVVELSGADDAQLRGILDGGLLAIGAGHPQTEGQGPAAPRTGDPAGSATDRANGELAVLPTDAHVAAEEGEPL
jgi:quercetin dioxygenase-like cupin family protein